MIGAIADDFTGGTDVAVAFRRAGLRTIVLFGPPVGDEPLPAHDAIVVALKTRTIDPDEAVRQSLQVAAWLRAHCAEQIYFKYCSTFDSRPGGNIGPVADALADYLGAGRAVVVPSSPEHDRTQYLGHLFVGRQLLSDSPMRHHPLTPMTDSFIPGVLGAQTTQRITLIDHREVRHGRERLRALFDQAEAEGYRYLVVDSVSAEDLAEIGAAATNDVLVTGAAGLAGGIGAARFARLAPGRSPTERLDADPVGDVPGAVLAGSCSARTREQVAYMRARHDAYFLDALRTPDSEALAAAALNWYDHHRAGPAPLVYSSLAPTELLTVQDALGVDRASTLLEAAMGRIAQGLVERGVRRLVVAGGETSGAVVTALGVRSGIIGDEAAPGAPWIYTTDTTPLALLLKSGNFGDVALLSRAVGGHHEKEIAP
ncbi:Uncharacterized conserved protein YgbK, DUF1537 family [Micromonospora pallida]|uniref:3-oxo-tetronate kinase n=1 Tax=Micromonospora pallida TaxID=145854 RepID=A0A1C6RND5_9ACTN|nr:3-oxo-tetronate kinase [Micromonospora pallida]SCL18701.1 Uncharacterized conserved protein YgbK, DUF1537 family [Micromonospora pallida]